MVCAGWRRIRCTAARAAAAGSTQVISDLVAGIYTVTISWIPDPSVTIPANSPQMFRLVVGGNSTGIPPGPFAIGNGITGNWYDPAQSGHGFSLEVLPGGTLLAAWFVFAPNSGRDWIVAVGPISGNTATLDAYRTDGPGGLFRRAMSRPPCNSSRGGPSRLHSTIATVVRLLGNQPSPVTRRVHYQSHVRPCRMGCIVRKCIRSGVAVSFPSPAGGKRGQEGG